MGAADAAELSCLRSPVTAGGEGKGDSGAAAEAEAGTEAGTGGLVALEVLGRRLTRRVILHDCTARPDRVRLSVSLDEAELIGADIGADIGAETQREAERDCVRAQR